MPYPYPGPVLTFTGARIIVMRYLQNNFSLRQLVKLKQDLLARDVPYSDCDKCLTAHAGLVYTSADELKGVDKRASDAYFALADSDSERMTQLLPMVDNELNRRKHLIRGRTCERDIPR